MNVFFRGELTAMCGETRELCQFSVKWQSQIYVESSEDVFLLRYIQSFPVHFPVMKEKEKTKTTELQQPSDVLTQREVK